MGVQHTFTLDTDDREALYDITAEVAEVVLRSGVKEGVAVVYVQGATAAIMIQENCDVSVQTDVVDLLAGLAPRGVWQHDRRDGNGDAHLKSGLVGPSESVPIIGGRLGLSRWQNIFLCEFDGPRSGRSVVVTVLSSSSG
jgi:secondary thiamine-phosphate synthase enzyme